MLWNTSSTLVPQLDFSELSCLLYLVCHWLKELLLKIWLWPDFCTVRCFGFCHGFVYFHVILKLLKIFTVSTWGFLRAKASALASLHHVLSWEKLLLWLFKHLKGWILQEKQLFPSAHTDLSPYVSWKSSHATVLFSQHYIAGYLSCWMWED